MGSVMNPRNLNRLRDTQPELGGVDWLPYKATPQPHRLSPEQFDAHPYAVFHSTTLDPTASKGVTFDETNWKRHHGTLQASVDRMLDTGRMNARIYSGWHIPDGQGNTEHIHGTKLPVVHRDKDANPLGNGTYGGENYEGYNEKGESPAYQSTPTSMFYSNNVEDKGSLSVVAKKPSAVRSHEDYVGQAISEGKAHEVHPRTLALYKAGKLSSGDTIHDVLPTYAKDERAYHQRFEPPRDTLPGLEKIPGETQNTFWNRSHRYRKGTSFYPHTELPTNLGPQMKNLVYQMNVDQEMAKRGRNG